MSRRLQSKAGWLSALRTALDMAMLGLPGNLVFGMVAFAPLGGEYIAGGMLASLFSAFLSGLIASAMSGTRAIVMGPRPTTALIIASILAVVSEQITSHGEALNNEVLLGYALIVVALGGLFQLLFSALNLGVIVRFIPTTVISGFVSATALLIIFGQLPTITGLGQTDAGLEMLLPGSILLALISGLATWFSPYICTRIPEGLVGLITGSLVFHAMHSVYPSLDMGSTLPSLEVTDFALGLLPGVPVFTNDIFLHLPDLLLGGFGIALVASVDTLLTSAALDNEAVTRSDNNRDLTACGTANLLGALFGGIPTAGKLAISLTGYRNYSYDQKAVIAHALVHLPLLALAIPLLPYLPKTVLGGVAIVVAIRLIEPQLIHQLRDILLKRGELEQAERFNLFVVISVVLAALLIGMLSAVLLGVLLSVVFFLFTFSGSIIQREMSGTALRSPRQRNLRIRKQLEPHLKEVVVLQLDGAIFFGSAEILVRRVEQALKQGARYVILDLRRVVDVDATGAAMLHRLVSMAQHKQRHVLFSYISANKHGHQIMTCDRICSSFDTQCLFADTSEALEWCEERLLTELELNDDGRHELPLSACDLLTSFSVNEVETIQNYLTIEQFAEGEVLFRQGDPSSHVLFIAQGLVSVSLDLRGGGSKRVSVLGPGGVVGEMALIDGKPRSANLLAESDLRCFRLDLSALERLRKEHPDIALHFTDNLCRLLSERLRQSSLLISELES